MQEINDGLLKLFVEDEEHKEFITRILGRDLNTESYETLTKDLDEILSKRRPLSNKDDLENSIFKKTVRGVKRQLEKNFRNYQEAQSKGELDGEDLDDNGFSRKDNKKVRDSLLSIASVKKAMTTDSGVKGRRIISLNDDEVRRTRRKGYFDAEALTMELIELYTDVYNVELLGKIEAQKVVYDNKDNLISTIKSLSDTNPNITEEQLSSELSNMFINDIYTEKFEKGTKISQINEKNLPASRVLETGSSYIESEYGDYLRNFSSQQKDDEEIIIEDPMEERKIISDEIDRNLDELTGKLNQDVKVEEQVEKVPEDLSNKGDSTEEKPQPSTISDDAVIEIDSEMIDKVLKEFNGKEFDIFELYDYLGEDIYGDNFNKDEIDDKIYKLSHKVIGKLQNDNKIKYDDKNNKYVVIEKEKEEQNPMDTSSIFDLSKYDFTDIDLDDDITKGFSEILGNIDNVEKEIIVILEEFSNTNSINLEGKTLNEQIHNLYNALSDDAKEDFASKINPVLGKLKGIKEDVLKQYVEALNEGNKKLKEIRENIEKSEEEIEVLANVIDEVKELEERQKENIAQINEWQKDLDELEEIMLNRELKPDEQKQYDIIREKMSALKQEGKNINDSLSSIYSKYGVKSSNEMESLLEQKENDINDLKDTYEKSEQHYLKAADAVRVLLFDKGIVVSSVPFEDLEIENSNQDEPTYTQPQEQAQPAQQVSSPQQQPHQTTKQSQVAQQPAANQQQGQPAQQTAAAQQQAQSAQGPSVLPSTNIDSKKQLDSNVSTITSSGDIWDIISNHQGYSELINNFDVMSKNRARLSGKQKRALKDAFVKAASKAYLDMSSIDEKTLNTIESVVGKDNFDLIKSEICGKGKLLKDIKNGFRGLSDETKDAMQDSVNKCYAMLKNGEITEEEFERLNNGLLKPLRLATLEKSHGDVAGNKLLNFFRNRKDNSRFDMLSNSLSAISSELNNRGYDDKFLSRNDDRTQDDISKNYQKSFIEGLADQVRSGKDELDIYAKFDDEVKPVGQKGKENNLIK